MTPFEFAALATAIVFAAVLFVGGVFVLVGALWVNSHAAIAMVRARANSNQADAEAFTMQEAIDSVEDARSKLTPEHRRVSAAEIAAAQRFESTIASEGLRGATNGRARTEEDEETLTEPTDSQAAFGFRMYETP